MPQEKKDTPAMKALKSVRPSVRTIQAKLGIPAPMEQKKKKKGFFEEIGSNLSGLRYLPDYLTNNPRPRTKR